MIMSYLISYDSDPIIYIECRDVGPGGTSVDFYVNENGLVGIWYNENCPYTSMNEFTSEADDKSNVSVVNWQAVHDALAQAIEKGYYTPK